MLLSIIIPCYNSEKYIRETLESVKNQKFQDWECIIVNDGSTDSSEEIIRACIKDDSRFKLITTDNHGCAAARNVCLKHAQGKYIFPLDSDDILMPNFTYWGVHYLEHHPDISLFYGNIEYVGVKASYVYETPYKNYADYLNNMCLCSSGLYKRDRALEIGGYDENILREDAEFWIRYLYKNDFVALTPSISIQYRQRRDSRHHKITREQDKMFHQIIREKHKSIYQECHA